MEARPFVDGALARLRSAGAKVFSGRYTVGAWAVDSIGWIAAVAVLLIPISTYIWTSPRLLRDLNLAVLAVVFSLALAGLILGFAKRVRDQNRRGWVVALLFAAGSTAAILGMQQWVDSVAAADPAANLGGHWGFLLLSLCVVLVALGALPSRDSDRFGSRLTLKDVARAKHPSVAVLLGSTVLVVLASLYAGFFQEGIWVRRHDAYFFGGPDPLAPTGSKVLAVCGNAKGVSAYSQVGTESQFVRDQVRGTWSLVVLPDGNLDLLTFNDQQNLSYRNDGFEISSSGLRFDEYGAFLSDQFMVTAKASNQSGIAGNTENISVLTFISRDLDWKVLISSSSLREKGGLATQQGPRASSYLLLADCRVNRAR